MADSFTEVTSESWFGRIWDSIKSVLFGLILFSASFVLLFWNEGRAVHTARSLAEGAAVVVSVPAESVDAANDGKLVHVTAQATTAETLTDPDFGVTMPETIRLRRNVSMYQWKESKKSESRTKIGGSKETLTTYTYAQEWSPTLIDSSAFKESAEHANPKAMPIERNGWTASKVTLGAFELSDEQLAKMDQWATLAIDATHDKLPEAMKSRAKLDNGGYYFGADPSSPKIGDVKVSFSFVQPATVSIVARQAGKSFVPFQAKAGDKISMLTYGTVPADAMFKSAEQANAMLAWLLRAGGFLMMFVGLYLVFRPIAVLGDIVPIFGSLLSGGIGIACFLLAAFLSLVTISIAWVVYRPIVGISLLVLAGLAVYGLIKHAAKGKANAAAKASAAAG